MNATVSSNGRFLRDFEPDIWLGHGGFGSVRVATKKSDQNTYAVKIVKYESENLAKMKQARQEVLRLAALRPHQNIIRYFDCWIEEYEEEPQKENKPIEINDEDTNDESDDVADGSAISITSDDSDIIFDSRFQQINNDSLKAPTSSIVFPKVEVNEVEPALMLQLSRPGNLCFLSTAPSCNIVPPVDAVNEPVQMQEGKPGDHYLHIVTALYRESLMKWYEAKPLIKRKYRKPLQTDCMKQLSSAMWHCHKNNIIHGDLKPENIFIASNEKNQKLHLVIGDFGLTEFGTPIFRSPEQTKIYNCSDSLDEMSIGEVERIELKEEEIYLRRHLTSATDVFTMGLVFAEFILNTEQSDEDIVEILRKLQEDNAVMDGKTFPDTAPQECRVLIKEMTEKIPSERPSFEDVLEKLRSVK